MVIKMDLAKILKAFKPKPKPRPIYVDGILVGYDDGLPNSINIDRNKLRLALTWYNQNNKGLLHSFVGLGLGFLSKCHTLQTRDEYADIAIAVPYTPCQDVSTGGAYEIIRSKRGWWQTEGNVDTYYFAELAPARSTSDVGLWKCVNGSHTQLATEAVDLTAWWPWQSILLQAVGTTISLARAAYHPDWALNPDASVPSDDFKITVTDTSIASGAVGVNAHERRYAPTTYSGGISYFPNAWVFYQDALIRPPSSELPSPLAYFEVPVEFFDFPEVNDDGSINITRQFYGVKMPEEIVAIEKPIPNKWLEQKVNVLKAKGWTSEEIKAFLPEAYPVERVNRLAMTYSALIPTDNNGKPKDAVALLRVFGGSPEYVHPIEKRIQALKEMRGVRELKREEAIDLALKMDDKLHIHDLVPCTKHDLGGKCFKEYRDWRIYTVGDKEEHADTLIRQKYVNEGKGW